MAWWPALVLAVSTAILQSHAIPYWVAQAGLWGWLWSPGAELLAWWFLSRDGANRILGAAAAAVVVGGPLAQMALPAVTEARAETRAAESLRGRIADLEADIRAARGRAEAHRDQAAELRHYSDGRHQRQVGLARGAEQEASRLRDRRRQLQQRLGETGGGMTTGDLVRMWLHGAILVLAWAGSVSAVSALAHAPTTPLPHPRTREYDEHTEAEESPELRETQPDNAWRVDIAMRLYEHIRQAGPTQQQVADAAGIPTQRAEVSRALKERHGEAPSPAASDSVFGALERYLDRAGA